MRILRILQSQSLPCGCFVGVYETYEGRTVAIVEESGTGCPNPAHRQGRSVQSAGEVVLREAASQ
jgi:hypothetical protein